MLRFLNRQTPLTIVVEILFALVLVMIFLTSQGWEINLRLPFQNSDLLEPSPLSNENSAQPSQFTFEPDRAAPFARVAAPSSEDDPLAELDCRELVLNGDFEDLTGWQVPITDRPASFTNEQVYSGERALKLGASKDDLPFFGESVAAQSITLPEDADFIQLSAQIWQGTSGYAEQYFWLEGTDGITMIFYEAVDAQQWLPLSYNLTPMRGQTVRLLFGTLNSGEDGRSVLYVDELSVRACRPPVEPAVVDPMSRALFSETQTLLLPLINKVEPIPTPLSPETPQATKTPVAEVVNPCTTLLRNGDFEDDTVWIRPVTNARAQYSSAQAVNGNRSMRLGLPRDAANLRTDSTAYQIVLLPDGEATLTLRAQVWREGADSEGDFHYLWVNVGNNTHRVFQDAVGTGRWRPVTYDLTPFAGRRVLIFLGTYNDGNNSTARMYVDDIQVEQCAESQTPATPAPTPTPNVTPTSTPTPDYAPPAEMSSPDFGVNAFLWWRAEIADRDLGLIADGGFNWVRQSFAWEDIELVDDSYDWSIADRVVQDVNKQGINLLARLGTDPELSDFWAGAPPDSLDQFVDYVAVLARRYNCTSAAVGCIQAYQIWNEPNLAREWGGNRPNPAEYLDMLGKAYRAIKDANPNAIVISAGMAPTGTDNDIAMPDQRFYEEMYRLMQGNSEEYFDMLGVHAAGFAAPPEVSPALVADTPEYGGYRFFAFRHVEDIRSVMEAYGDDETRIAVLEFGWTSDSYNEDYMWFGAGAGIDEFVKADYLKRAYAYAEANWQPWIALMSVLSMPNLDWTNDGNPLDEEQYWWAIMEPSTVDELKFRPAYITLCDVLNQRRGTVCPYLPE